MQKVGLLSLFLTLTPCTFGGKKYWENFLSRTSLYGYITVKEKDRSISPDLSGISFSSSSSSQACSSPSMSELSPSPYEDKYVFDGLVKTFYQFGLDRRLV